MDRRDLNSVAGAVVGVRGWHTDRFYPSTFEQTPEILKFLEKESVQYASRLLGGSQLAKILCLPRLPASGALKNKTIQVLKGKGVDGVISFRTMLAELIADGLVEECEVVKSNSQKYPGFRVTRTPGHSRTIRVSE